MAQIISSSETVIEEEWLVGTGGICECEFDAGK